MALTHDAIFKSGADASIPSGYTLPTTVISQTTPFTVNATVYSMAAASGVSTTSVLGITALHTAFESWLAATFIPTTLGIDITNTVTAIATITKVKKGSGNDTIYLNDATHTFDITFTCTIEVS